MKVREWRQNAQVHRRSMVEKEAGEGQVREETRRLVKNGERTQTNQDDSPRRKEEEQKDMSGRCRQAGGRQVTRQAWQAIQN